MTDVMTAEKRKEAHKKACKVLGIGRPFGSKKENVKKEKIVIYVLPSKKARLEKEASVAGYTLNVY